MMLYTIEPQEFEIVSSETDELGDYHYTLKPVETIEVCPFCSSTNIVKNGNYKRSIRDLNQFGARVGIELVAPRYICRDCESSFKNEYKTIQDGAKITNRLRDYIREQSLKKPFLNIADELGMTDTTIRRIFLDYVEELDGKRKLKAPRVLGIDENHLRKQYRAVFTDIEHATILEILPNRSKVAVSDCIKQLDGYENIECFTIDMHKPYKEAIYSVNPNAYIVIDKFHVVKMTNEALEKIRRRLNKSLPARTTRSSLRGSKYLLLSNQEKLTKQQLERLEQLLKDYPVFKEPYELKEEFRKIYNCETKAEAIKAFEEWKKKAINIYEFAEIAETVERWKTEIFNYFDKRFTNATTECLNKLINDIDTGGKGYSFDVLRAKALYGTKATKKPKYSYNFKGSSNAMQMMSGNVFKQTMISGDCVDITELQNIVSNGEFF